MILKSWTELARRIDHTFLKAYGAPEDIEVLCKEAVEYDFAMVAVHPSEVARCARLLSGTSVHVGAAIGFPLGQNTREAKIYEAEDALRRGAQEIDMVINIRALQAGRIDEVREELLALSVLCKKAGAISKVILETCYLTDPEKRTVCRLATEAELDFVKTSTGFGPAGATVEDVRLMREASGPRVGVKASGGIRTLDAALAMIEAGATRLGTSSGVALVKEFQASIASCK